MFVSRNYLILLLFVGIQIHSAQTSVALNIQVLHGPCTINSEFNTYYLGEDPSFSNPTLKYNFTLRKEKKIHYIRCVSQDHQGFLMRCSRYDENGFYTGSFYSRNQNESRSEDSLIFTPPQLEDRITEAPYEGGWKERCVKKVSDSCNYYCQYLYDKDHRLVTKIYNNPELMQEPCSSIEKEEFSYYKNRIVIVKTPAQPVNGDPDQYINEIHVNTKQQVDTSVFYGVLQGKKEMFKFFICKFDSLGHLETVYYTYHQGRFLENIAYEYKNTYNKKGQLISVEKTGLAPYTERFHFNERGLLAKKERIYSDGACEQETFSYTFY